MPLIVGGIVPHAPLLLEGVAGEKVSSAASGVKGALESFLSGGRWDLGDADLLVIASSHGTTTGVFGSIQGSLQGFGSGLPSLEASGAPDVATSMAAASGLPLLDGPVDHGVLVPLLLLNGLEEGITRAPSGVRLPPIVAFVQAEDDPDPLVFGRATAEATRQLATDRSVAFLASAHTSAGLTPRAPLTELPAGKELDARLLEMLGTDVGNIASVSAQEWAAAGSCGAGPLTAFGELFKGSVAKVAAYEAPYGVGYLAAGISGGA